MASARFRTSSRRARLPADGSGGGGFVGGSNLPDAPPIVKPSGTWLKYLLINLTCPPLPANPWHPYLPRSGLSHRLPALSDRHRRPHQGRGLTHARGTVPPAPPALPGGYGRDPG